MKYEVILFDADETLFDFKKSEKEAFKNTMLDFDIAYDENYHLKVYKEINTAIWKEFEQGLIKMCIRDRWINLSKLKASLIKFSNSHKSSFFTSLYITSFINTSSFL